MRYKITVLLLLFTQIFFSACSFDSRKENKPLIIATNSWIGYVPIFYANEKGYLKKNNIQISTNVSLAEAADLYSIGKADLVTSTQHEYYSLREEGLDIIPTILIDRSYGGDMILSNKSIKELQEAKSITAYLEINSINREVLQDFLKLHNIPVEKLEIINKDQAQIEDLTPIEKKAMLIVTYIPYNLSLEKRGFHIVASTKNISSIIVIDALCCSKELYNSRNKELKELKKIIDRSIDELMQDKEVSYELVKKYLNNLSYQEYLDALTTIVWINHPSQELLERIEPMGYKEKYLIK